MADGTATRLNPDSHSTQPWTEIFRSFTVALDPRKLGVAALGIFAMSLGWYVLSSVFYYDPPSDKNPAYDVKQIAKDFEGKKKSDGKDFNDADFEIEAARRKKKDLDQWRVLADLAGPQGKLSTMPWKEDRGANPYVAVTNIALLPGSQWFDTTWSYFKSLLPTMIEPLTKLLLPVFHLANENATTGTRIYLILCLFWSLSVWALAGGIITRIAVVQLSNKDRCTVFDAARFVMNRFVSYLASPLVPLAIIGAVTIGIMILGMLALIPVLGDILYIVIIPLTILGGVLMTVLLLGLVGYPMMYGTLSAEGSDTFDALSRSYNYVFQAPWTYAWNCLIAVTYGAVVTFVILLVASLMVYLGKWALTRTPFSETTNQRADYLFVYAPQSFGWQELLLRGSPIEKTVKREEINGRPVVSYVDANPDAATAYMKSYTWWNYIGAGVTTFWITAVFLLMLGFSYSYFWSASTVIYLLMRQKIDDVELDEVYLEDDEPLAPLTPPSTAVPSPTGVTSLPTVPAPATPPVSTLPVVPTEQLSGTGTVETPKIDAAKK